MNRADLSDVGFYRYITVATMSDEDKGSMVCVKNSLRVGVPTIDFLRDKSRDLVPNIRSGAAELYETHFGDFSMVNIPNPEVPLERRFKDYQEEPFDPTEPSLYSVMAFTALDVNRYHGGALSFVDQEMTTRVVSLPMNDVVMVGYMNRTDFPSSSPPSMPENNRVNGKIKDSMEKEGPEEKETKTSGSFVPRWNVLRFH